jgi:hypothetical protein
MRRLALAATLLAGLGGPAGASGPPGEPHRGTLAAAAEREARRLLDQELFGHYDVVALDVQSVELLAGLGRDYGLARVRLAFSTRRNATRHPSLSPTVFQPDSPVCRDWLSLHCGVPAGHVFDGRLELLLAVDGDMAWRAVSPHWRARRRYPLHGYLLLEGRQPEGYVLFPRPAR